VKEGVGKQKSGPVAKRERRKARRGEKEKKGGNPTPVGGPESEAKLPTKKRRTKMARKSKDYNLGGKIKKNYRQERISKQQQTKQLRMRYKGVS